MSQDAICGLPIDLIRYWFLLTSFAQRSGLKARYLKFSLANTHIYKDSLVDVPEMLKSPPKKPAKLTDLEFNLNDLLINKANLTELATGETWKLPAYKLTADLAIGKTDQYKL